MYVLHCTGIYNPRMNAGTHTKNKILNFSRQKIKVVTYTCTSVRMCTLTHAHACTHFHPGRRNLYLKSKKLI